MITFKKTVLAQKGILVNLVTNIAVLNLREAFLIEKLRG